MCVYIANNQVVSLKIATYKNILKVNWKPKQRDLVGVSEIKAYIQLAFCSQVFSWVYSTNIGLEMNY